MEREHPILQRVRDAKADAGAADELIRDYMPFILEQTARFLHRPVEKNNDDELSVAMLAFYEATQSYSALRGSFLHYAALTIRSRLIDYTRSEKRHSGLLSANATVDEDGELELIDQLADEDTSPEIDIMRQATRAEIEELSAQLASFGVSLTEVSEHCPRQERTLRACQAALQYARENPGLLEEVVRTGKVPLARICAGAGLDRKTLERHRRYLLALLLAYTNGYEIIRGHLKRIGTGGMQ